MTHRSYMSGLHDTIAAISTPIGEGGIGIVRLSGKKALSIADRIFVSKNGGRPSGFQAYSIHYGHIIHHPSSVIHRKRGTWDVGRGTKDDRRERSEGSRAKSRDEIIDEVLLTVMRAPKSYTKEDVVEINCHGGIVPLKKTLEEVVKLGARPAEPGEFTKRAFLNGRIDLTQAEAVIDVIRSKTDASLRVAVRQLEGDFSKQINLQREKLLDILQHIEAQIDFSEEELGAFSGDEMIFKIRQSHNRLEAILDTQNLGMLLKEGVTCVICGKPNVGKSSLLNTLLRMNRAIVTHIPGTTRDAIEESVSIGGIPLRIVDTAGIVKSRNIVDKKSVEITKAYLKKTDLVIFMLDLSRPFDKKDKEIMKRLRPDRTIIVANKSDLKQRLNLDRVKTPIGEEVVKISILKKKNLSVVEEVIAKKIWAGRVVHPEAAFLTNIRHKKELEAALKNLKSAELALKKNLQLELVVLDIRQAIFHLGLIIGKSVDIDILDRIFQNFCIGK